MPGTQFAATDINYALNPNARYLVQADWAYGCTPSRSITTVLSNITTKQPTAVANISPGKMELYPNPVTDMLTVQTTFDVSHAIPVLCNLTGQQLSTGYSIMANKIMFNTGALAAGVYYIKLVNNGQQITSRFVRVN